MKLEIRNLLKKFNSIVAVDNINFEIEENKTLGLLGPNGCGKTTSIGMMLGLIKPTTGQVIINNQNIFGTSQNDGLLIESTYIAQSESTEFSIEQITGGTWHLYAFSNHEALPFSLKENGELRVDRIFDYETEEKNYALQLLTTDDHNLSFIKEYSPEEES